MEKDKADILSIKEEEDIGILPSIYKRALVGWHQPLSTT
jgi:hypothetical protein